MTATARSQSTSTWNEYVESYRNARAAFASPLAYTKAARETYNILTQESKAALTHLLQSLEADLRTMDSNLEAIRAKHTNKNGEPYQGPIHTENALFASLEISADYHSWFESFQAVISQPMNDIHHILTSQQQAAGVAHVQSQL